MLSLPSGCVCTHSECTNSPPLTPNKLIWGPDLTRRWGREHNKRISSARPVDVLWRLLQPVDGEANRQEAEMSADELVKCPNVEPSPRGRTRWTLLLSAYSPSVSTGALCDRTQMKAFAIWWTSVWSREAEREGTAVTPTAQGRNMFFNPCVWWKLALICHCLASHRVQMSTFIYFFLFCFSKTQHKQQDIRYIYIYTTTSWFVYCCCCVVICWCWQ